MKKTSKKSAVDEKAESKKETRARSSKKQAEPEIHETPDRVMGHPIHDISALEPDETRRPRQQTTDLKSDRKKVGPGKPRQAKK